MAADIERHALAAESRELVRRATTACLATLVCDGTAGLPVGAPFASLALSAVDHDAAPLLLLSTLAVHTQNLNADRRISLLYEEASRHAEPMTGARVTLAGRVAPTTEQRHRDRFLSRHASAADYADFKDFAFYRLEVDAAHSVAGFGQIKTLAAADWRFDDARAAPLIAAEAAIVEHMNTDHQDAVALYAMRLLSLPSGPWRMTGIDPEGLDLAADGRSARIRFEAPIYDPETARRTLVRLAESARGTVAPGTVA